MEFHVSADMVQEWRHTTREEQLRYKEKVKKAEERRRRFEKRTGNAPVQKVVDRKDATNPTVGAPVAPPLSQPIAFLEDKLSQVKLCYQYVPDGFTDWINTAAVANAFPPPKGCSGLSVPQGLLQDAQTVQDKLIVMSWWRFLSKEEQRVQNEELRKVYAVPLRSNRKLPPDFWEKIAAHENNEQQKKKPHVPSIDPTGNDFYVRRRKKEGEVVENVRDMTCRGWRGDKYVQLFRECYGEAIQNVTMKDGARILETIPVSESLTRSKHAKDLVFVREGDDYVLRSVGCTKKRTEGKHLCNHCRHVMTAVAQLKSVRRRGSKVEGTTHITKDRAQERFAARETPSSQAGQHQGSSLSQ